MATPSSAIEQLRPDLGYGVDEFDLEMNRAGFVGLRILPVIEVALAGDSFTKRSLAQILKRRAKTKRAANGTYGRSTQEFADDSYACKEYGFECPVDHRDAARYRNLIDAEQVAAEESIHTVMLDFEGRILDEVLVNGGVHETDVANEWNDAASGTPVTDVSDARQAIYDRTGLVPNVLVLQWKVADKLKFSAEVIERLGSTGFAGTDPKKITPEALAACFEVDEVIIAKSMENTANQGQTATLAPIWPKAKGLLFHRSASNNLKRPRLGNVFHWGLDGSQIGGVVEQYYSAEVRGDVIRHRIDVDEKVLHPECGEVLTGLWADS